MMASDNGVPQVSIFGHLLFIIYINDMPSTLNTLSVSIIFADDTSVIISSKNLDDFYIPSNRVLSHISKWFATKTLAPNLDKTNIITFITKKFTTISIKHWM
jgi:hypothetical protein